MQDYESLEEWLQNAPDHERRALMKKIKKRFIIFLLISIIPLVNFITMGLAIFCYNTWSYVKSRGRNTGSGLVRLFLMLYAYILPPIIVVTLCSKIRSLGSKVTGM